MLFIALASCAEDSGPEVALVDKSRSILKILKVRARAASAEGLAGPPAVDARVELESMTEEVAARFFSGVGGKGSSRRYDPDSYWFGPSNQRGDQTIREHPQGHYAVVTNSLGMREDSEPAEENPQLRILVTGDSHTDGVCENVESFSNQLEALLQENEPQRSVEVLNAGRGGFSFHNYLGVYQKFRYLEPDVFIVAVYLGNDFCGDLTLYAWNERQLLPAPTERLREIQRLALDKGRGSYAQCFRQMVWFNELPETYKPALESAQRVMGEIATRCAEDGVELIVVFIPSADEIEWDRHRGKFDQMLAICQLDEEARTVNRRLANELQQSLTGIPIVDGKDVFVPNEDGYYWRTDKHLNLTGHRALAEALTPVVETLVKR